MERPNFVVIEDNILEFLDEIQQQMKKGIICCKCNNPCTDASKCRVSMRNLLTDIQIFKNAYSERNPEQCKEIPTNDEAKEQVVEKTKQQLND